MLRSKQKRIAVQYSEEIRPATFQTLIHPTGQILLSTGRDEGQFMLGIIA